MAKASMHFAYYLFLLTFCINEGDGRWKKADREILQRDIKLYKKIAERVEHELQEYEEYVDNEFEEYHDGMDNNLQHGNNVPKNDMKLKEDRLNDGDVKQELLHSPTRTRNDIPLETKLNFNDTVFIHKVDKSNIIEKPTATENVWPKFEDILIAMGKKYDWKNDRWIKVKEKFKRKDRIKLVKKDENEIFHEKHHFSYRSVKLNRGKNKRNVVIAVTAIR